MKPTQQIRWLVHRTRRTVHRIDCVWLNSRLGTHTKPKRRPVGRLVADPASYEEVSSPKPPPGRPCSRCLG
jgi:hypothetical protein